MESNIEKKQQPVNDGGEKSVEDINRFSKEQILNSNWYSHRRDALEVLLKEGETYSYAAVDKLISDFMKGKVK